MRHTIHCTVFMPKVIISTLQLRSTAAANVAAVFEVRSAMNKTKQTATNTVAICFVLFIADQTSKTAATFAAAVGRSCSVEIITFGMNTVQ